MRSNVNLKICPVQTMWQGVYVVRGTTPSILHFYQGIIARYPQNLVTISYFIWRIFTLYVTYCVKACDNIKMI